MANFTNTLKEIRDIEKAWVNGEIDIEEATAVTRDLLKNAQQQEDAVIPFKDYEPPKGSGKNHIPTNIQDLDDLTGGVGKGDIILISGNTGDGKSSFARFLIKKLAEENKKSLVFSYEETNEEFLSKFKGELPDGYLPRVLTSKSPTWIEAKVLEATNLYGVEVVFIDNLKGMIDYETRRSEVGEVDRIIQSLKAIAIKYDIVLFLLAHIKKSDNDIIDKNSLTGSKTIVDTASVGIALYRNPINQTTKEREENGTIFTDYTTFYLIKNRYKGKYNNFIMKFDEKTGLYSQAEKADLFAAKNTKNEVPN